MPVRRARNGSMRRVAVYARGIMRRSSVCVLVCVAVLGSSLVARAIKGPSPATAPPVAVRGELVPAWEGALPGDRDSTDFDEFRTNYRMAQLFEDLGTDVGGDELCGGDLPRLEKAGHQGLGHIAAADKGDLLSGKHGARLYCGPCGPSTCTALAGAVEYWGGR